MLLNIIAVVSIVANIAYSQYRFNGQGLPAKELYEVFSEYYNEFYPVWNSYLSEAVTKYPDAYKQLTSFYGTTEFPGNVNPSQLSGLVSKIASVHETTIVDKDVNPSTLIFETPTGSTVEQGSLPAPTTAYSSVSYYMALNFGELKPNYNDNTEATYTSSACSIDRIIANPVQTVSL